MTAPSRSGSIPTSAKGNASHNEPSDLLENFFPLKGGGAGVGGGGGDGVTWTVGSFFLDTLKGIVYGVSNSRLGAPLGVVAGSCLGVT